MHAVVEEVAYDRPGAPVTMVFGDDPIRRARIARLVAERGGRLAGNVAIGAAAARLDAQAVFDLLVIDAAGCGPDDRVALAALLARIAADKGRVRALVNLPVAAIDDAAAIVGLADVEVRLDADMDAIAEALDALTATRPSGVAEEGEDALRRRLEVLGAEVERIARTLAAIAVEAAPGADGAEPLATARELAVLRDEIRLRRLRERFFARALFADPAWDILLDLRVAALERRQVAVSSLCIAAAVPPTTGLRWISLMTRQGLLERVADPGDGRRMFVMLSAAAGAAMAGYAVAAERAAA